MSIRWASWVVMIALWATPAVAAEPRRPCDYFVAFLGFRFGAERARELLRDPIQTRDEANGFCEAAQSHGGEWVAFTMWKADGGRRLFAFEDGASEDRPGSYVEVTTFWTYEQGAWVERKDVLPELGLDDFWPPGKPVPEGWRRRVRVSLVLPRKGTAITAMLMPAGDGDAEEILGQARYRELTLLWDRAAARFTKGARK